MVACEKIEEEQGHQCSVNHSSRAELFIELHELGARRKDLIRARTGLTNRIRAITRRLASVNGKDDKKGLKRADDLYKAMSALRRSKPHDKDGESRETDIAIAALVRCLPFLVARDTLDEFVVDVEREMIKIARQLPVYAWVKTVKGFGEKNLACLVAETGDLSNYANPSKVWKRMGLAVIRGERQRKTTDADLAIEMGYSPERRAIVFVLGDCLIKGQGRDKDAGPYRKAYDEYKARKTSEMVPVCMGCKGTGKVKKKKKLVKCSNCNGTGGPAPWGCCKNHRAVAAQRYMEKRVLRDLWRAWRAQPQEHTTGG
jgi:hypothetical protein